MHKNLEDGNRAGGNSFLSVLCLEYISFLDTRNVNCICLLLVKDFKQFLILFYREFCFSLSLSSHVCFCQRFFNFYKRQENQKVKSESLVLPIHRMLRAPCMHNDRTFVLNVMHNHAFLLYKLFYLCVWVCIHVYVYIYIYI